MISLLVVYKISLLLYVFILFPIPPYIHLYWDL
jgi:hypothetical protein